MDRGAKSFLSWRGTELDFKGVFGSVLRGSKRTVIEAMAYPNIKLFV